LMDDDERSTKDYLVGPTIDEGAFGKVLYAKYKATGKDVAIKVITKLSIKKEPQLLSCIYKEKRLLIELKSSHIIPLLACFHDSECLYFVMECAFGGNLSFLISNGLRYRGEEEKIWLRSIPYYTMQLLTGLEYIHSKNIIHADLKPENILVRRNRELVLADFGSAVELNSKNSTITHSRFLGTTDYSSPEVIRGEVSDLSVGVDLWSFGCIIYAMWEGASPFHNKSDALSVKEIMNHHSGGKELLANRKVTIDENWMSLILDLLSPEPSSRIGLNDYLEKEKKGDVSSNSEAEFTYRYTTIRARTACWKEAETTDNEKIFQSPDPPWCLQAKEDILKDGAEGWSAFLL